MKQSITLLVSLCLTNLSLGMTKSAYAADHPCAALLDHNCAVCGSDTVPMQHSWMFWCAGRQNSNDIDNIFALTLSPIVAKLAETPQPHPSYIATGLAIGAYQTVSVDLSVMAL